MLENIDGRLIYSLCGEKVIIEPWGKNALRVRATKKKAISERAGALGERVEACKVETKTENDCGEISNGKIKAKIDSCGNLA